MDERKYAKTISKNLRRIMHDVDKTQAEVSRALNINKATLSSWMNGTRIPRMKNIDTLCHYFNISRTELMEEATEHAVLTHEESVLLDLYGSLNKSTQKQVIDYIRFLTTDSDNLKKTDVSYNSRIG